MRSEIPERAQCKSLCSQDMRETEIEKSEQDWTSARMKGWAARLLHRFSSAEWITDTYFHLRVEFLKFGLGGKRCLWQSPVWFWWELATNPTLRTHTHTRTQTAAFSPSAWSTALTPPGGRGIVILASLAPSICRSERCGCWVFSSPVH